MPKTLSDPPLPIIKRPSVPMKHRCNHPPKHASAVMQFLRELGAEVVEIAWNRTLRLSFVFRGQTFPLSIRRTASVTDAIKSARIAVHRMLNRAGFAVPLAA